MQKLMFSGLLLLALCSPSIAEPTTIALGKSSLDPSGYRYFNEQGTPTTPFIQTGSVTDIAFGPNETLFALVNGNTVREFDLSGNEIDSFIAGSNYGSISISSNGVIALGLSTVDPSGFRLFSEQGSALSPIIQTPLVGDLSFGPNDELFVLTGGNVVRRFNEAGAALGSFNVPSSYNSIAVSTEGVIALGLAASDPSGFRLFNDQGVALTPVIQAGQVLDLAFEPEGNLFLLIGNNTVREYDTQGNSIGSFTATPSYNSIAAVPEAESIALAILGIACFGLMAKRPHV